MNYFASSKYAGGSYQFKSMLYHMKKSELNLQSLVSQKSKFTFLDSGCGDGSESEYILKSFPTARTIGFDISERQIAAALQRCQNYKDRSEFIIASFDTFKMKEKVDFVLANFSLHLAPSMERALKNIIEPLKPNVCIDVTH